MAVRGPRAGERAVTVEDALAALAEHGVTTGIDSEAVTAAVAAADGRFVPVARGEAPVPGRDGEVELLFPADGVVVEAGDEENAVDWRWRVRIPQVREGEELARLRPPTPGRPGRSVRGEEIPPRAGVPSVLRAGPGAGLSADGVLCRATTAGFPTARRLGRTVLVQVLPVYHHAGDVDLQSGNVAFGGGVTVAGGVQRGAVVRAGGVVTVKGDVEGEVHGAAGVVIAGKVFGGRVTAGVVAEAAALLGEMERFSGAVEQLLEKGVPTHLVVRMLIQSKFASLRTELERGSDFLAQHGDWREEAARILLRPGFWLNQDSVARLVAGLRERAVNPAASVQVSYLQNASVEATGTVRVLGQGAVYSTIKAGGRVEVRGRLRNCTVAAGGDVVLHEVGSSTGGGCVIAVPAEGRISFRRAYPDTVVRVGDLTCRLEAPFSGLVTAHPDGRSLVFKA